MAAVMEQAWQLYYSFAYEVTQKWAVLRLIFLSSGTLWGMKIRKEQEFYVEYLIIKTSN